MWSNFKTTVNISGFNKRVQVKNPHFHITSVNTVTSTAYSFNKEKKKKINILRDTNIE